VSETLERIYRVHRDGLFTVALSITRCAADAEDAVHEAFARLCRRTGAVPGDPVAYTFAAVRNAAVDRLRRSRGMERASMELTPCMNGGPKAAADKERDYAIAAAVDGLAEDVRAAVVLRVFAGLTFRQAAEVLDVPLPTVVSRYRAGLERLRPRLKDWL
jgi:RNA polymerase sigma-70 factor (ECF subfamily)